MNRQKIVIPFQSLTQLDKIIKFELIAKEFHCKSITQIKTYHK
jgi:hypothetical protein